MIELPEWYQDTDEWQIGLESGAEIVLIGLGTNDAKEIYWTDALEDPAAAYLEAYAAMISALREALGSDVLVVPLVPVPQVRGGGQWPDASIINDELPPLVDEVVAANGLDLSIDLRPPLLDEGEVIEELYADNIHPNDDGLKLMAETIGTTLASYLGVPLRAHHGVPNARTDDSSTDDGGAFVRANDASADVDADLGTDLRSDDERADAATDGQSRTDDRYSVGCANCDPSTFLGAAPSALEGAYDPLRPVLRADRFATSDARAVANADVRAVSMPHVDPEHGGAVETSDFHPDHAPDAYSNARADHGVSDLEPGADHAHAGPDDRAALAEPDHRAALFEPDHRKALAEPNLRAALAEPDHCATLAEPDRAANAEPDHAVADDDDAYLERAYDLATDLAPPDVFAAPIPMPTMPLFNVTASIESAIVFDDVEAVDIASDDITIEVFARSVAATLGTGNLDGATVTDVRAESKTTSRRRRSLLDENATTEVAYVALVSSQGLVRAETADDAAAALRQIVVDTLYEAVVETDAYFDTLTARAAGKTIVFDDASVNAVLSAATILNATDVLDVITAAAITTTPLPTTTSLPAPRPTRLARPVAGPTSEPPTQSPPSSDGGKKNKKKNSDDEDSSVLIIIVVAVVFLALATACIFLHFFVSRRRRSFTNTYAPPPTDDKFLVADKRPDAGTGGGDDDDKAKHQSNVEMVEQEAAAETVEDAVDDDSRAP
ncbi:hypothetical protein CTAYLR_008471 [Chrysophaeum taylorii]|uniref:SGNH hydrolase-type esterase domain-containing protein n=1 Tax=Chrysophaeum taylorii TaxID=2483200 RepID=A0AAD7UGT5_9STRA|nr:hypothetical protein CTAYLR_008471 [Chrysophaeum taylorii]